MEQAGLVTCRKEGLKVCYTLCGDDIIEPFDALAGMAERHLAKARSLQNGFPVW